MITTHAIRRVTIPVGNATLYGDLSWPIAPGRVHGLAVVAHANSGSRLNPRNQAFAAALNRAGLATLLTDLLTTDEDQWEASAVKVRYDIALLTARLHTVVDRLARLEIEVAALPVAIVGTGTTAAAALRAAAELTARGADVHRAGAETAPPRSGHIDAVVCRSGRPDLAEDVLGALGVPALHLVGEHDHEAQELHRRTLAAGGGDLCEVPGYADLVDDPAAVQPGAQVAAAWLVAHLDPVDDDPKDHPAAAAAPAPVQG